MTNRDDPREIAGKLTKQQREVVLHHTVDWSRPCNAQAARRMWFGIRPLRTDTYWLLQRRHGLAEYRLTPLGLQVRAILLEEAGRG